MSARPKKPTVQNVTSSAFASRRSTSCRKSGQGPAATKSVGRHLGGRLLSVPQAWSGHSRRTAPIRSFQAQKRTSSPAVHLGASSLTLKRQSTFFAHRDRGTSPPGSRQPVGDYSSGKEQVPSSASLSPRNGSSFIVCAHGKPSHRIWKCASSSAAPEVSAPPWWWGAARRRRPRWPSVLGAVKRTAAVSPPAVYQPAVCRNRASPGSSARSRNAAMPQTSKTASGVSARLSGR